MTFRQSCLLWWTIIPLAVPYVCSEFLSYRPADLNTMKGAFPPSFRPILFTVFPHLDKRCFPTSVENIKNYQSNTEEIPTLAHPFSHKEKDHYSNNCTSQGPLMKLFSHLVSWIPQRKKGKIRG